MSSGRTALLRLTLAAATAAAFGLAFSPSDEWAIAACGAFFAAGLSAFNRFFPDARAAEPWGIGTLGTPGIGGAEALTLFTQPAFRWPGGSL